MHAVKRHLSGTHRLATPAETVKRMQWMMPVAGITRIADVTGLDTIGIPVVMVVRPNARSLSVSQGKGIDLDAARASGLMESLELWHAEQTDRPLKLATYNELRFTHRLVGVANLPRLLVGQFHQNYRTLWIEGTNLLDGSSTWVPYEMVHMDYTLPFPSGSGSFLMSSRGLASGNDLSEALVHALCELIEHDCTTLHRFSSEGTQRSRRVDLATVDDPVCRGLLDMYERAGVEVAVWDTASDVGVAAFMCTIVDREPNPHRPIAPMGGLGCHLSRAVALSRALTEAAQSRLTVITGVRDDVRHQGPQGPDDDLNAARKMIDLLAAEPRTRSFREVPDRWSESFEEDVAYLLERLRAVGIEEVVTVDLTKGVFGVPVVRTIVPGLEPLSDVPGYVPGARAQKRLTERML
ncbi:YcaO-like family protein [Sorangium sp. So ce1099]|uniref:YcaO-like family protein n=1 Tax=Sorangium sp. So ce1099 TaxID=3133331 RepID=UPI003F61C53D